MSILIFNEDAELPHNESAEAALLGAILHNNENSRLLNGEISSSEFYIYLHQVIFEKSMHLINSGRRADLITLMPELAGMKIGDIPASNYVQTLPERAPGDPEQIIAYRDDVSRFSAQRDLIMGFVSAANSSLNPDADIEEITKSMSETFENAAAKVRSRRKAVFTSREIAEDTMAEVENDQPMPGVSTGIKDLDGVLGALAPGEMSIWAGRPGQGKTTLISQVAINAAAANAGVYIWSGEMGHVSLGQRVLSGLDFVRNRERGIAYKDVRNRNVDPDQIERMRDAAARLSQYPIQVNTRSGITPLQLGTSARRAKMQFQAAGTDLELLVVDYLTLMSLGSRWGNNRVAAVGDLSTGLKTLSMELECHVAVVAQLNRGVELRDDKRPMMADLRESGQIEQDADTIVFCCRDEYYLDRMQRPPNFDEQADFDAQCRAARNKMELIVGKQRMGDTATAVAYCNMATNYVGDWAKAAA